MLVGRVRAVGPAHPASGALRPGERLATLVSLSLTPLRLDRIRGVRPEEERIDCDGEAILFSTGLWARLPADLPEAVALATLDVCGAPALAARHLAPGQRVLVLGAGKSGALVAAQARASIGPRGVLALADRAAAALEALAGLGADLRLELDATDPLAGLAAAERAGGPFDLVVNCTSLPGTEMASVLAVRERGAVIFFSMATSFTAAALGAEGVGMDATLLIGNGYVPGHADLALGLVRGNAALRGYFEARFGRGAA